MNRNLKSIPKLGIAAAILFLPISWDITVADTLACGDIISTNVKLELDLVCVDGVDGLIVDGDNITIDLGTHTITGPSTFTGTYSAGVRVAAGSEHVNIRNGTVDGFDFGVFAYQVKNLSLNSLNLRNQLTLHGIEISRSSKVSIKKVTVLGPTRVPSDPFSIGIALNNIVDMDIDDVSVYGHHRNLSVSCFSGNCGEALNSGVIKHSTFLGGLQGVTVDAARGLELKGNHISGCVDLSFFPCTGLALAFAGPVSQLVVKNNSISYMRNGIDLNGIFNDGVNFITDSTFSQNHITNNFDRGILVQNGVTGNTFRKNILFGNGFVDLFHDVSSTPNLWVGNSCETKIGADIPDC